MRNHGHDSRKFRSKISAPDRILAGDLKVAGVYFEFVRKNTPVNVWLAERGSTYTGHGYR
jgi:hypothetical protein